MGNPNGAKGAQFERDVVKYLNATGFPLIERAYGAGRPDDRGDLSGSQVCWELKNHRTIDLAGFMDELAVEKANARLPLGVAVIKRRGKGPAHAYAVMTLEDMATLLAEAGYAA